MADTTAFRLNGKEVRVQVAADMPLVWAIRETLNLTGTKLSCGVGLCGACTVHVDGKGVRSCVTPTGDVAGRSVTTIEGLAARADDPVQQTWIDEAVAQCGFCQPGFIMAASAFLKENPRPTDAQIDAAITNICRCGTFPRIRRAIHVAAKKGRARG